MKLLRTFALIATLLAAVGAEAIAAPQLPEQPVLQRDTVMVSGEMVRLGDLFQGVGDKADTPVAYAPAPGRRAIFDARWLYRVAQGYGLDWRPASLHEQVTVERESTVIGQDEIEHYVLDALAAEGVNTGQAKVRLSNRMLRLHLPADAAPDLAVEDITYDARRGRFTAVLAVYAEGADDRRIRITGQLQEMVDVPVLARAVAPGDVIGADDIRWIAQRSRGLQRNIVTSADDLVGLTSKRRLRAGVPVSAADVHPPVVVGKGDLVTIVYETARMQLTARGQAMENGSRGQSIRVANLQSRQIVEATVRGPGTVVVGGQGGWPVH